MYPSVTKKEESAQYYGKDHHLKIEHPTSNYNILSYIHTYIYYNYIYYYYIYYIYKTTSKTFTQNKIRFSLVMVGWASILI